MLFNSVEFIFLFLPGVLLAARFLKGPALLRWITLSSFIFYALAGRTWFLLPMLATTAFDFWLAPRIASAATPERKKALLAVSVSASLGLLFYFKYAGLFLGSTFAVLLPAGISFYTFQTLAYVIDVYRGDAEPERDFWKFAGFVSFFPHLVAGPLTRHDQLLPALGRIAAEGVKPRWQAGLFLFSVGLIKKVLIADRLAILIDPMINDAARLDAAAAWLALLGYALQIYFDFSGYCDMAIGLGRLFGIELPQNFNSPYQAKDPSDFWRRWHMTLSAWLRDYLYLPLGGRSFSAGRRYAAVMATMLLGGLWHGANWTFVAWGFYHGALIIGFHRTKSRWRSRPVILQRAATFTLVTLGWVFFRSPDFHDAALWLAALFDARGLAAGLSAEHQPLLLLCVFGVTVTQWPRNASGRTDWERLSPPFQTALGLATVAAVLWANSGTEFLYFQF